MRHAHILPWKQSLKVYFLLKGTVTSMIQPLQELTQLTGTDPNLRADNGWHQATRHSPPFRYPELHAHHSWNPLCQCQDAGRIWNLSHLELPSTVVRCRCWGNQMEITDGIRTRWRDFVHVNAGIDRRVFNSSKMWRKNMKSRYPDMKREYALVVEALGRWGEREIATF